MDTSAKPRTVGRHGGARPGAGRKPGTPYRSSIQGAKSLRERFPVFPLEYMLNVINDPTASHERKDYIARAAAPYVHPRLASVDINNIPKPEQHNIDLTKLSDEELALFTRLVAKGQRVIVVEDEPEDVPLIEYDDSGYKS